MIEPPGGPAPKKRRNGWVWVSGLLAIVVVGLGAWGLAVMADRDSTQDELDSTQQELASTQQELEQQPSPEPSPDESDTNGGALVAAGGVAAAKAVYEDLTAQLGATEQALAEVEQDLEDADADAKQAEQEAATAEKKAEQASNETDKAQAEADKAKADAKAAESKATVVAECARAYLSAFGTLFEGDDVQAQADQVRERLRGITDECKAALGEA